LLVMFPDRHHRNHFLHAARTHAAQAVLYKTGHAVLSRVFILRW
jgi:hypothetical protein